MTQLPPEPPPPTESPGAEPAPPPPGRPRRSRLAVASLGLSALGICTAGIASIVGFIAAVVAIARISRSEGRLRGAGLAVIGLVSSAFTFLLGVVVAFYAGDMIQQEFQYGHVSNVAGDLLYEVGQLSWRTVDGYAPAHDGRLPDAQRWRDDVLPYIEGYLPRPPRVNDFTMNERLSDVRLDSVENPGRIVLYFYAGPGAPSAGGEGDLPLIGETGEWIIGFADGHAETVKANEPLEW